MREVVIKLRVSPVNLNEDRPVKEQGNEDMKYYITG